MNKLSLSCIKFMIILRLGLTRNGIGRQQFGLGTVRQDWATQQNAFPSRAQTQRNVRRTQFAERRPNTEHTEHASSATRPGTQLGAQRYSLRILNDMHSDLIVSSNCANPSAGGRGGSN